MFRFLLTKLDKYLKFYLNIIINFCYNIFNGEAIMKIKREIFRALSLIPITLIMVATASAHSGHDNSVVPFKWNFTNQLYSKIERNLSSAKPSGAIGLNRFEQKKFDHYGIKVGNKFNSAIRNVNVTFKRTSAGLMVVDASAFNKSMNDIILPLKKVSKVSRVSIKRSFHPGHDHKRIPVEWTFGDSTNSKIVKHMFEGKGKLFIGLTSLEQGLLKKYGIKSGNKFQLSISGHSFLVEKTSGGITIINHVENQNVAKVDLNKNNFEDKI